ncbi:MAG: Serine/threonine-protein kinase PknD [Myxococcota bacterium]|nr:Serine/threonine-protein kinase PknD [Myxococcota bacterium]
MSGMQHLSSTTPGCAPSPERDARYQRCPNCNRPNDVSTCAEGQKITCRECGVRFSVDSATAARTPTPPPDLLRSPHTAKLPAFRISGYRIKGVIGQGGMGVIYLAEQESLSRDVAIKVLAEKWAGQEVILQRFHREAAALANLRHPNIITIIDKGESMGQPWFVMEYIKGKSLRDLIDRGPLNLTDWESIIIQICRSLEHAHAHAVVHRDIKPENILIDHMGNVKLADFGLAALVDPQRATDNMTRSQVAMGTFNYMAPEQRRNAKTVDRRADVYSLGVVMYEMLTGFLPEREYRPPSTVNPQVPPAIDDVIARCLATDPDGRFETAQKLKEAVRAACSRLKISGVPRSNPEAPGTPPAEARPEIRRRLNGRRSRPIMAERRVQAAVLATAVLMTFSTIVLLLVRAV